MTTLYLASPLGFAASTQAFMTELQDALRAAGFGVHNPWEAGEFGAAMQTAHAETDPVRRLARVAAVNHEIAATNERAIRDCDWVVGVLDGVDVDSGTASEMGFGYGLGKRISGLRTDTRLTGDNAAAGVNLQVRYWIDASGGAYTTTVADLIAALTT